MIKNLTVCGYIKESTQHPMDYHRAPSAHSAVRSGIWNKIPPFKLVDTCDVRPKSDDKAWAFFCFHFYYYIVDNQQALFAYSKNKLQFALPEKVYFFLL